jgi:hypothetical protein
LSTIRQGPSDLQWACAGVLSEEIVEVGDFPEPKGIGYFTAVERDRLFWFL